MAGDTNNVPQNNPDLEAARAASRRRRSIALALALLIAVVLFYVLTITKMGPEILNREL